MASLTIAELIGRFPDFRVALVVAEDLSVGEARGALLNAEIEAIEAECRRRWSGVELSAIPGVAAWRAAYKGFGIKRTSYRSSVERLIKRVLAGGALPPVNALVDLYNAVSLQSALCLGCDDLDRIEGDLAFRFSRANDTFVDMGAEAGEDPNDPPKVGEVVYANSQPRAVPALELAPGRAQRRLDANPPRRAHHPVQRLRRSRRGREPPRRADRARVPRAMPRRRRRPRAAEPRVLSEACGAAGRRQITKSASVSRPGEFQPLGRLFRSRFQVRAAAVGQAAGGVSAPAP